MDDGNLKNAAVLMQKDSVKLFLDALISQLLVYMKNFTFSDPRPPKNNF